jgi:hypothetical protein
MERYGLFKRLANGAAMWVCASEDLKQARATIQNLSEQTGLEYFIHDFQAGTVVVSSRKKKAVLPRLPEGA